MTPSDSPPKRKQTLKAETNEALPAFIQKG